MKILILSLILASTPSMAKATEISLDIQYSRLGEKFCEERMTVTAGEVYQICEKDFHGKKNWLRMLAYVVEGKQIKLHMAMEEQEASGQVIVLSSPKIVVNDGAKAELTQGAQKDSKYVELESIAVVPKIER